MLCCWGHGFIQNDVLDIKCVFVGLSSDVILIVCSSCVAGSSDSVSPTAVFNPPSKKTVLLSTSSMGPKPVYFTPMITQPGQVRDCTMDSE